MTDEGWSERRLVEALELMARIAAGEYGARGTVSERDDLIDGVMTGLNLLAENFQAEHHNRVRAEGLLKDAVDAYENAPGLFCSVRLPDHLIVKCNQTLADHLGRDASELARERLEQLFVDEDQGDVHEALRLLSGGEPLPQRDYRLKGRAGVLMVRMQGSRVPAGRQDPGRLRLILRDVTAERELQTQLAHTQKIEAIGQLAGGVAHDLNNILTVIQSAVAFLRRSAAAWPRGAEGGSELLADVEDISQAAHRAAELTTQLLALSRRSTVPREAIEVEETLDRLTRMLGRTLGEPIVVRLVVEGPLGSVWLGRGELEQVLMNLALNARDAMPRGGTLTLRAWAERREGRPTLCIDVVDSGTGMSEEIRRRAFEPFFTTKGPGEGTGLGLAVCEGLLQQAGGTLALAPNPDRGVTVHVTLPLVDAPSTPAALPTSAAPGPRGRILVVEDEPLVRRGVVRLLHSAGYTVEEADDGVAARRLFKAAVDLVITDVVMPGERGTDLVRWLREQRPFMPVLFMTGYAPDDIPLEELGEPIGLVRKPFDPEGFLTQVRDILARGRAAAAAPSGRRVGT